MKEQLITLYFEADHKRLDNLFIRFQKTKHKDFPTAKNYFRAFLRGLKRHIVWEEDVLFPAFERAGEFPPGSGPTEVMRYEHREIGQALEAIHARVRNADPNSDAEERILLERLGTHNMKEEKILYPAIDQHISSDVAAELFLAMECIPEERYAACCGQHGHPAEA